MKIAAAARKPITHPLPHLRARHPRGQSKVRARPTPGKICSRLIAEHWTPTGLPGIMHCFSGNDDQAARSLAAGFYLSFAGNVTYPKSTTIQAVAAIAPADRILVETDAPFLAPIPLRGQTNEPAFVAHTARFVAELRGITPDQLAELTTANFGALFPASLSVSSHI